MNPTRPVDDLWEPYEPDPAAPWDLRRVAHLHRRAGFAATPEELRRDLDDGPGPSLGRLLETTARADGLRMDFAPFAESLAAQACDDIGRLRAWWVYRMLFSPDPLGERLTLMWHDHFATGQSKVRDAQAMRRQNEMFRRLARAPFGELLTAAARDPALLVWLDAPANTRGRPNENLARELMELFTLGPGHYSEADVKEAARALTGWTVEGGKFREAAADHDDGEKTLLGRAGRWAGSDLLGMLLEHPATSRRLASRVVRLFLGDADVPEAAIDSLAEGLRARRLDVGWAVATVLRSRRFFAAESMGRRVLGPAEFVVGAVRALGLLAPPPSTFVLAEWVTSLGQALFDPPNVGGWAGGLSWLSTRGATARARFATDLVAGRPVGLPGPVEALGLAARHGRGADPASFYAELLTGRAPNPDFRDRLAAARGPGSGSAAEAARSAIAVILASPEAQLI